MTVGIGIYSGGNPYTQNVPYQGSPTQLLFDAIYAANYTSVVIWAAHVDTAGNISVNDSLVASGGSIVADADPWAQQVSQLKQGGSVSRVELSIGGDSTSFANIKALIAKYGTGSNNPLYGNLSALKDALDLDAINYDDESVYDTTSSTDLAQMCVALKMSVTFCPYTNQGYWVSLAQGINISWPETVDAVYLQCYDGGAGNSPSDWNSAFAPTGLTVAPGFWSCHPQGDTTQCTCNGATTAAEVQKTLAGWSQDTTLDGGWMFVGTAIVACPSGGTLADYASDIAAGLGIS